MRILLGILLCIFLTSAYSQTITAQSWSIAEPNGKEIASENADAIRPIASITKLMTVIVVLNSHFSLDEQLLIHQDKRHVHFSTHIPKNIKSLSRRELISLALVKSDNLAAFLLCANYDKFGYDPVLRCIDDMNFTAKALGMNDTTYVDPTGLYPQNVSTAKDLTKLAIAAAKYPIIVENSDKDSIRISNTKKTVTNTNTLIGKANTFLVSKTGWIKSSGGCLLSMLITDTGTKIIVVLGSKNTRTRIAETEIISKLIDREDQDWLYRYLRIER